MKRILLLILLLVFCLFSPSKYSETKEVSIDLSDVDYLWIPFKEAKSVIVTLSTSDSSDIKLKFDYNPFLSDNSITIKKSDLPKSFNGKVLFKITTEKTSLFPLARSQIEGPLAGLVQNAQNFNDYTAPDWKQVFIILADSKGAFSSDTDQASPSPTAGTAFQFDHVTTNSIIPLTSTDLVNAGAAGANRGSPAPQFCITYNSLTGLHPVMVDGHLYGSYWSNATASLSWDTNGRLYETMRDRAYRAMHEAHVKKPAGIFITLGINDNGSATAIATVQANMQAIINRLANDFGSDVPVYITMTGVDNSTPGTRLGAIRSSIRDLTTNNSQVHETVNEGSLYSWDLYDATPLHWKQAGNNFVGSATANYIFNAGGYTDKKSRQTIYCYLYDQVNSTRKAAINTFWVNQRAAGNLALLDMLQIYKGDTEKNILIDWGGLTSPLKPATPFTFNANSNIASNGTSTYLRTFWNGLLSKYASQNDILVGIGTGTISTTAGTAGSAFGASAGNVILLAQNASNQVTFALHNSTPQTYPTDTKIQNNSDYGIWRTSSTNLELLKSASVVSTKSVASTGLNSVMWDVGCRNNANPDTPTAATYIQGEFKYIFQSRQSGFNYSSFLSDLNTLLAVL